MRVSGQDLQLSISRCTFETHWDLYDYFPNPNPDEPGRLEFHQADGALVALSVTYRKYIWVADMIIAGTLVVSDCHETEDLEDSPERTLLERTLVDWRAEGLRRHCEAQKQRGKILAQLEKEVAKSLFFYMTPVFRLARLKFTFEETTFFYHSWPSQLRFRFGDARMALLKKEEGAFSVWVDNLKLGEYASSQQIPESPLRQTVELGLRALAAQSAKIEHEYRQNKPSNN